MIECRYDHHARVDSLPSPSVLLLSIKQSHVSIIKLSLSLSLSRDRVIICPVIYPGCTREREKERVSPLCCLSFHVMSRSISMGRAIAREDEILFPP